jgi:outer membrane protein assembly factor BamB
MRAYLIAAAAAAVLACAQQSFADDASNFQIDAAHDGQVRFKTDFHAPLKRRWFTNLGATVSSPVYGDGMVFVATASFGDTVFYALDASTGVIKWSAVTAQGGAPSYAGGRLFIADQGGAIEALDAKTGAQLWVTQQTDESIYSPTLTATNKLLYRTGQGSDAALYALKPSGGKQRFEVHGPGGAQLPAVGGGDVYQVFSCQEQAFDAATGASKWTYADDGCVAGVTQPPVYFGGKVYVNDGSQQVVLDAGTGAVARSFVHEGYVPAFWTPSAGDPLGFVIDSTGATTAFDTASGSTVWSLGPMNLSTPPLVINDTVFVGNIAGYLLAFDAATGTTLQTVNVGGQIGGSFDFPSGLGAGGGMLFVPAGNSLQAWVPKKN